jgi:large subunit ribosomal protein L6
MSNLARQLIKIPSYISAKLENDKLFLEGPLSNVVINLRVLVFINKDDNTLKISDKLFPKELDNKKLNGKALQGTTFAIIRQHILGLSTGFRKQLNLIGVGYRASIESNGLNNTLNLRLGYSHKVQFDISTNLKVICLKPTIISIYGFNKEDVCQLAAKIKGYKLPEPYKGKGILYQDEKILRKEGKRS